MKTFIGIDLGSTTTKAVVLDEDKNVLGRGITNSRSNYDIAANVAKEEALLTTRFTLLARSLTKAGILGDRRGAFLDRLESDFRLEQFLNMLMNGIVYRPPGTRHWWSRVWLQSPHSSPQAANRFNRVSCHCSSHHVEPSSAACHW